MEETEGGRAAAPPVQSLPWKISTAHLLPDSDPKSQSSLHQWRVAPPVVVMDVIVGPWDQPCIRGVGASLVHGFGGRAAALEESYVSTVTNVLEVPCRSRSDGTE